jgi:Raf kinase inhibitor-like YbhB/YbcL family protein
MNASSLSLFAGVLAIVFAAAPVSATQGENSSNNPFHVSSKTFTNDATLPISAINNIVVNGTNSCSINGAVGGNQSPELFWTGTPQGTKTFVVTAFDVTASFTHWGIYNIPGNLTGLPENAGVLGSKFGMQILNDFGAANEYDGPCPPANVAPYVHDYVFTVYALDIALALPSSANFPANSETLYQALIGAGKHNHILASTNITGFYSSTPAK